MSRKLLISIDTGNAAFTDPFAESPKENDYARRQECAELLKRIAGRLEAGQEQGPVHDTNGNFVGNFRFTKR